MSPVSTGWPGAPEFRPRRLVLFPTVYWAFTPKFGPGLRETRFLAFASLPYQNDLQMTETLPCYNDLPIVGSFVRLICRFMGKADRKGASPVRRAGDINVSSVGPDDGESQA